MPGTDDAGNAGQGAGAGQGSGEAKFEMKIGDRSVVVTPEYVENLLGQKTALDQKVGSAAAALKTAEKYGVPVEEYLQNAEAALFIAQDLIRQGVLDEQGNLIKRPSVAQQTQLTQLQQTQQSGAPAGGADAALHKAMSELSSNYKAVNDRLAEIEMGQSNLIRRALETDVLSKHPHLDNRDLKDIFALSRANPKVDFWEVVDKVASEKQGSMSATEEAVLKKYGLDPVQLKERIARKEGGELSGGPSKFVEGKKLMFGSRAKKLGLADAMPPGMAAEEWQQRKRELEQT